MEHYILNLESINQINSSLFSFLLQARLYARVNLAFSFCILIIYFQFEIQKMWTVELDHTVLLGNWRFLPLFTRLRAQTLQPAWLLWFWATPLWENQSYVALASSSTPWCLRFLICKRETAVLTHKIVMKFQWVDIFETLRT